MKFSARVEDSEGNPMSDAVIQFSCSDPDEILIEETDCNGCAYFELDTGYLETIRVLGYCGEARKGYFEVADGDELVFS